MAKPQLILCGSIAIDRIMNFSGRYKDLIQPDKLHVLSLSVLLEKMEDTKGGVAANIAHSLAMLGEQPLLYGSVGKDARLYIEELSKAGVDTNYVHFSELPTASFNVMTDLDDNQVGGFYPGAMANSASLTLKPWAGQNAFVCVSAHDPAVMRRQTEECGEHKIRLMYDPGQQVSNISGDDLRVGIDAAEVLVVNDYELGILCRKTSMSEVDVKAKVPLVITTYGKAGSQIEGTSVATPLKIAIAKPDKVVDPTGAGDAFRAGFLYGYLRQWELQTCGQLGSTLASMIIEQHGTQRTFDRDDVKQRYEVNFNQEITF